MNRWPTLTAIGLTDALDAIEGVLASNQLKHPGSKWSKQTEAHHIGKAVGHLSSHECGDVVDWETQRPALAHVAARVIMALALHLKRNGI